METPPTGSYSANEARTHARSIADTRRKIAHIFEIPPDRLNLTPALQDQLTADFANDLHSNRWTERRDSWRNQPLNNTEPAELDKIAQTAMQHYAEGFYLREQIKDCGRNHSLQGAEVDFFRKFPNNSNLLDNHLMHIFHATQAKLEHATSGNVEAALKMHGYLIERSIFYCKGYGMPNARFQPDCRDLKHAPQECIDRMKDTGESYTEALMRGISKANVNGELTHAARVAHQARKNTASVPRF